MLWQAWHAFRDLLLPAHCAACGLAAPADTRWPLCRPCSLRLAALIETPFCPRCGRTAGPHSADASGCAFCRKERLAYDAAVRVGPYEEPLRTLILRCKYERKAALADVLGRLLAQRLAAAPWADLVQTIVPVPLHWTRRVHRGFNQSALVAGHLAAGDREVAGRLMRVRATVRQPQLPVARRRQNVRGAFEVRRAADVAGRHVLVLDDVMASGSTIGECARMLRRAGARSVLAAFIATADYDECGMF
jgi:ComF family protein